ncbi:MAG: acylphosphatase [Candidatus Marsarchaeota archaeon]|nr:acylphosphatase [Candidatus Marsarchaeota archaeon]
MKVTLIVHGVVQGVGYRNLVRDVARRRNVTGHVRNLRDGSVEVVAVGDSDTLALFEKEIAVSYQHGPQVMHIERAEQDAGDGEGYDGFRIERSSDE